jgi:hypothetical protein
MKVYDEEVEDYVLLASHKQASLSFKHEFEILDAGTFNNLPLNTRPRGHDLNDTRTQKFSLRFNESFILRSENVNRYLGTRGKHWQSDLYLTDDVSLAERFTILPVPLATEAAPTPAPLDTSRYGRCGLQSTPRTCP